MAWDLHVFPSSIFEIELDYPAVNLDVVVGVIGAGVGEGNDLAEPER
jgi:hypothetical protein